MIILLSNTTVSISIFYMEIFNNFLNKKRKILFIVTQNAANNNPFVGNNFERSERKESFVIIISHTITLKGEYNTTILTSLYSLFLFLVKKINFLTKSPAISDRTFVILFVIDMITFSYVPDGLFFSSLLRSAYDFDLKYSQIFYLHELCDVHFPAFHCGYLAVSLQQNFSV